MPVVGVQFHDAPPVALKVVVAPLQILTLEPAPTVGNELTVTITFEVLIHPLLPVPVTVYVAVRVGLAVGDAHVVQDNPVVGVHV